MSLMMSLMMCDVSDVMHLGMVREGKKNQNSDARRLLQFRNLEKNLTSQSFACVSKMSGSWYITRVDCILNTDCKQVFMVKCYDKLHRSYILSTVGFLVRRQ
jgi:hypothetical protein